MTSPLDIIELPGQPGKWGRRILVEAWQRAGSPPVNSKGAGRLYGDQKYLYDGWRAGWPGFFPADNPDDESQRLAHVRFGALDIDPTPARINALSNAGLYRPYEYEPWHWEVFGIRNYPIVRALPTPPLTEQEISMIERLVSINSKVYGVGFGQIKHVRNVTQLTDVKNILPDLETTNLVDYRRVDAWANLLDFYAIDPSAINAQGLILDPFTGTYAQGNAWSEERATRAELRKLSARIK